jgi:hypothetical protein
MRTKCLSNYLVLIIAGIIGGLAASVMGQEISFDWFPVHIADHWVYQNEQKGGESQRPDVARWTTEETVTDIIRIPEGQIVLRKVQSSGSYKGNGYVADYSDGNFLVRSDCIYFLGTAWDSGALDSEYLKSLNKGEIAPDLCFPLEPGKQWGTRDRPWRVEGMDHSGSSLVPPLRDSIHIVCDHFGSGGRMDIWFQRAAGIVAERYVHSGTVDEYSRTLQQFTSANKGGATR